MDRLGELVGVIAGPDEVVGRAAFLFHGRISALGKSGVAGFKEPFHLRFIIGGIEGNRDEIDVSILEAAVCFHKVGKLCDAGAAGG